jgi:hypothetical protein
MNHFDIFLSYSSKDKSITDQLVTHVEDAGFACWIAPRNIEGGAEYSEVIEKAILKCKIFLLVFSENSEKSPWVKSELNIAFSENKYIIPYKIDATPLKGTMRLLLNDKHWIEKSENEKKQMDLLLSAVQNFFAKLEKGDPDSVSENSFYAGIAKSNKRKKMLPVFLALALFIITGAILFGVIFGRNQKNIKHYNELVEKALSIPYATVSELITARDLMEQAQKIENDISISYRKNISTALYIVNYKLDSIYLDNLETARTFAIMETANGDNQALECYKLALQIKEDPAVRDERDKILSRKGMYE